MKKILPALLALLLFSCGPADDWISRRYPNRRFFFFQQEHPTSQLFSIFTASNYSYYYVYSATVGGVRHIYVQSSNSAAPPEDHPITTDRERNAPFLMGATNETGLIIGLSNFNGPLAYDRICPNCSGYQPLRWASVATHVTCSKCQREYDLETGAVIAGEGGEHLMRYGISYDGTKIYVGN
jgi:nitrite reductase/ring-hydroxylating ferredoxin subunit